MKRILPLIALIMASSILSSCGYSGHFRYPCQDPANWENEECKPPLCVIDGACPEDLVDLDQLQNNSSEEVIQEETTQDGEIADE